MNDQAERRSRVRLDPHPLAPTSASGRGSGRGPGRGPGVRARGEGPGHHRLQPGAPDLGVRNPYNGESLPPKDGVPLEVIGMLGGQVVN